MVENFFSLESSMFLMSFMSCLEMLHLFWKEISGFRITLMMVIFQWLLLTSFRGRVGVLLGPCFRFKVKSFPFFGVVGLCLRSWSSPNSYCKISSFQETTYLEKGCYQTLICFRIHCADFSVDIFSHFFIVREIASLVWYKVFRWLGLHVVIHHDLRVFFEFFLSLGDKAKFRENYLEIKGSALSVKNSFTLSFNRILTFNHIISVF